MTQDYTWLLKELLQYKAELSQGLNELAGNGTPEEQAVRRMYAHIEQMTTEAYKKGYEHCLIGKAPQLKSQEEGNA